MNKMSYHSDSDFKKYIHIFKIIYYIIHTLLFLGVIYVLGGTYVALLKDRGPDVVK